MTTTSILLTIAREIRHNILSQVFTGFETFYDYEGKRHINQQECDEYKFSICMVNKQLRDESILVVKARTAILDCTEPSTDHSPHTRATVRDNVDLSDAARKNIQILKLQYNSKIVPDQHLSPTLQIIAVASWASIGNNTHVGAPFCPSREQIITTAKSNYSDQLKARWSRMFECPSRMARIWVKETVWKFSRLTIPDGDIVEKKGYAVSGSASGL